MRMADGMTTCFQKVACAKGSDLFGSHSLVLRLYSLWQRVGHLQMLAEGPRVPSSACDCLQGATRQYPLFKGLQWERVAIGLHFFINPLNAKGIEIAKPKQNTVLQVRGGNEERRRDSERPEQWIHVFEGACQAVIKGKRHQLAEGPSALSQHFHI